MCVIAIIDEGVETQEVKKEIDNQSKVLGIIALVAGIILAIVGFVNDLDFFGLINAPPWWPWWYPFNALPGIALVIIGILKLMGRF